MMPRSTGFLALALAAALVSGCSDDETPAGPVVGSLEIAVATTGEEMDADGYFVVVGDGSPQAIGVNGTLTISGLAPTSLKVELTDVATNCSVAGSNPRTVVVAAGATVSTTFNIACQAVVRPDLSGLIAFYSDRDGNPEIYLLDADADWSLTRLTTDPAFDGVPALSPDGTKILFETTRGGGQTEIYVMNADGTGLTNLTHNPGGSDERPSWSPDGTRILFASARDASGSYDIFVMNADGSNPVNLTSHPAIDRPAAWSPDGTRIVFSSNRTGAFDIYVMDADGSNPVNLTNATTAADFAPAWSPDGTRIAFTRNPSPGSDRGDIWLIDPDGSDPVNLTNAPDADNRWPSWSPDGAYIVFTSRRTGNAEVFVMKADGSEPFNLSAAPGSLDIAGWPQAWSPKSPPF